MDEVKGGEDCAGEVREGEWCAFVGATHHWSDLEKKGCVDTQAAEA